MNKYYICIWKQNNVFSFFFKKRAVSDIQGSSVRYTSLKPLPLSGSPGWDQPSDPTPWHQQPQRGQWFSLRSSSAVSHSLWGHLCPRACLTQHLHHCIHLSLDGYKVKAGKHWPSELRTAGTVIAEHLPASWVPTDETHSPPGKTRKRVKWKPKPGGTSLPISSFCFSGPAARTHWTAPKFLARFPVCVVCVCVRGEEAVVTYLWSPSHRCGPDAS